MGRIIHQFLAHVVPNVARPLRVLWNEMVGLVFLLISLPAIWSAISNFRKVSQDGDNFFRGIIGVVFAAVMMFFGIYSFLRARKIARS